MSHVEDQIRAYAVRMREGAGPERRLPTSLRELEAESIFILRETAAEFRRPALLYSIGKDSTVLLHLALKAFYPALPPFPLLHVDSTWEFKEMGDFRDRLAQALGINLIVHVNEEGRARNINPFDHGSAVYTEIMRTEGLRQALAALEVDAAIGGARRDEEKSRAKERIFSVREPGQTWDPRNQRAELWSLYNHRLAPGQTMRVFPLSNWTELDIWRYIQAQEIPIVPLYFAAKRRVLERQGTILMVDDARMPLAPGEAASVEMVRFRTLGCYPLTGGIRSAADSLDKIVEEIASARLSERQGRVIDHDEGASMERKKRQGYF